MSKCPICSTAIRPEKLMCLAHWNLVSSAHKSTVNKAFKEYDDCKNLQNVIALRNAQEAAIAEVKRQVKGEAKLCTCDSKFGIDYCRQHTDGYPRGEE